MRWWRLALAKVTHWLGVRLSKSSVIAVLLSHFRAFMFDFCKRLRL